MEETLIDTDIIIDFLRGHDLRTKSFFSKIQNREMRAYISIISIIEIYAGIEEENNRQETSFKQLLSILEILPVDFNLGKLTGILRRKYQLSIMDSIIAATSSCYKIKLFTFNLKHFQKVPDLIFFKPGQ